MDQRVNFEVWLRSIWTEGYEARRLENGDYQSKLIQEYWLAWQAAIASAQQPASSIELPDPLEEIRAKFRGEWDYAEAGDRYYSQAQIVAYGQACAKAAAATNPLAPYALLVAALKEISSNLRDHPCYMPNATEQDIENEGGDAGFITDQANIADAALASIPTQEA